MSFRSARWLLLVASLLPMMAAGGYVSVHGQNVPFWDEWIEPMDNAVKTAEENLRFGDLTRQYNDSRPFFTNLVTVVSVRLFGWDLKAEMFFNQVLAAVTLLLLLSIFRHRLGDRAFFLAPLLSLLVFSLTQRRSLLWAIQNQYYFLILFVIAAVWSLDRLRSRRAAICLAALFSSCATFSFANGLLTWISMVPVLWLLGYRSQRLCLFWMAAGVSCLGLFFWGYVFRLSPGNGPPDPLTTGKFMLAFLGNALVGHFGPVTLGSFAAIASIAVAGLILFALNTTILVRWSQDPSRWGVWIGPAVFVVASCGVAAVGRGDSEVLASGMANRYVTLSLVFWIALLGIGAETVLHGLKRVGSSRTAKAIVAANLVLGAIFTGILVASSYRSSKIPLRVTSAHRTCLEQAPLTRDVECLYGLHPVFDPAHPSYQSRTMALDKIDRLAAHKLGVFNSVGVLSADLNGGGHEFRP